ncbi:MAG: hypothetical protein FJX94_06000, partial [Bacteroidetes bacterium]|nr:hypothetical protein [Bacteroidota bacterium]
MLLISVTLQAQQGSETNIVRISTTDLKDLQQKLTKSGNYDLEQGAINSVRQAAELIFKPEPIGLKHIEPFLSFSMAWSDAEDDAKNTKLQIRFSADGQQWDPWIRIAKDEH